MAPRRQQPVALTVAGSDSGGGAGIQADLRTFAAHDVHGTTAITCLTAQNPCGVLGISACTPAFLALQLKAVLGELPPDAIKTGMLYSAALIRELASALRDLPGVPLVVDPVMIATSGARLLKPSAERALCDRILPLATVITPNLDETAALLGSGPLRSEEDLVAAARQLQSRWGCAVLVKGGHLGPVTRRNEAVDILVHGGSLLRLAGRFVRGVSTHGTGCTYASAIAARLAHGDSLPAAVKSAKRYITLAIEQSVRIGRGHTTFPHGRLRKVAFPKASR